MFTVNDLKIIPAESYTFNIFAQTNELTTMVIQEDGVVIYENNIPSMTKNYSFKTNKDSTVIDIKFTNENGSLEYQSTCESKKPFKIENYVFYKLLYEAINMIVQQVGDDITLGLTAFLNMIKTYIRKADFTVFGSTNLTPNQLSCFEDQIVYYYACSCADHSVEKMVERVFNWFKYLNIDNIDSNVTILTLEQKAIILGIINQAIGTMIFNKKVQDIKTIIENLNDQSLVAADSALRTFYDSLGETKLPDQIATDYASLCQNGIGTITQVV